MHRIGAFSQLSKVTVAALRYYDEVGLLKPARVDPDTGYRLYTTAQLVPLQRIVALRQAGLSIEEVSAVLSGQA
ncbi:MerR family transcriptional regulator, partial [Pseudoflavonifractor sp. BIOML-A4]|nr:MerR family transcriptional regulator [Pseudoflavonifractor sp. BIOML-A4]